MNGCSNDGESSSSVGGTFSANDERMMNSVQKKSKSKLQHNDQKLHLSYGSASQPTVASRNANGTVVRNAVTSSWNKKTVSETIKISTAAGMVEMCSPLQRSVKVTVFPRIRNTVNCIYKADAVSFMGFRQIYHVPESYSDYDHVRRIKGDIAENQSNSNSPLVKRTQKERRFRRLFRSVPLNEVLISRFSCAFVSDIGLLLQGHMYVSNDWICFHSNIFGIEKIIEIPVISILTVSKSKTAKIIPNAVCIRTKDRRQYAFSSLISRDTTHHLLSKVLDRRQLNAPSFMESDGPSNFNRTQTAPGSPTDISNQMPSPKVRDENLISSNVSVEENSSIFSVDSSDDENEDDADCDEISFKNDLLDAKTLKTKQKQNSERYEAGSIARPAANMSSTDSRSVLLRLWSFIEVIPWSFFKWFARSLANFGEKRLLFWEHDTFGRVNVLIEQSLKLVEDVKKQLDALKTELHHEVNDRPKFSH